MDVPQNTSGSKLVNFMNLRNNPVSSGFASLQFGIARADRVKAKIYDVSGRLVRTLADRAFSAGEHTLDWDGTNDDGGQVARGVYFVRLRSTTLSSTVKLVVLR